jgi:methylenetetrahydrofolate--tRNA-(uracil-5-)-methyltransferase
LVCSNSLGSNLVDRASGLLKEELRQLGSLLIACADQTSVPAGGALAVDRDRFASMTTEHLRSHQNIKIIREEVTDIPDGYAILATGPLTSQSMSNSIRTLTGKDHLFFFDAISPMVSADSINMDVAFRASRYDRGDEEQGDYINCPFDEYQYYEFVAELRAAERIQLKEFDLPIQEGVIAGMHRYFEGCLPVEIIAQRGNEALAYGPMRPVGLRNPRTRKRDFAVVQLRQDNLAGSIYNLVGFQTNLKFTEQKRVFSKIPGLENAEFVRYGQMHRNTFIFSPEYLRETLQFVDRDELFFAGQITGVEGYAGNIGTGLQAGINASRLIRSQRPISFPRETMIGALVHYITHAGEADFQPMKANFGIMPALEQPIKGKRNRAKAYASRSLETLGSFTRANFA